MAITVSTPAESFDLTCLDVVQAELGLDPDATQDAVLNKMIASASTAVVRYCNREFAKQTIIETLPGPGGCQLKLARWPINSVTSVVYDGTTVAASTYVLQEPTWGVIFAEDGWEYSGVIYDYVVTYDYGYVLPSFFTGTRNLPEDIEVACIQIVKGLWFGRQRDSAIRREEVDEVYSVEYKAPTVVTSQVNSVFTPEIQMLLDPYRAFNV